jgi:glycyl-tRNA synthetase
MVAPIKVLLVPLSSKDEFKPTLKKLSQRLRTMGIASRIDDSSASIGKRYSRNDELGTPFGVTLDFQTLKDSTITLRERDSTRQVRATEEDILAAIRGLTNGSKTWKDIEAELPAFTSQEVTVDVDSREKS